MGWDFLDVLDPDVSSKILMCLDDPPDIARAGSVSRSWRDFVISKGICKHLCLKLFPQLSGISRVIDISKVPEKHADVGCSRSVEWEHLKKEHSVYTSLARGLTSTEVGECLSGAISASSTDNYPEEGVHNTLESRDRIGRRASYWSSSGQSNPEVPETLTYKLISDLCVITEINLQPFQAFFQANLPIYSAKAVRFRMGHRILPDDGEIDFENHEGQPPPGEKYVWTYTSHQFQMVQGRVRLKTRLTMKTANQSEPWKIKVDGRDPSTRPSPIVGSCLISAAAQFGCMSGRMIAAVLFNLLQPRSVLHLPIRSFHHKHGYEPLYCIYS